MATEPWFGIHEMAVKVRARRATVLANNIANADTPGYKARDLDFKKMLQDFDHRARMDLVTGEDSQAAKNVLSHPILKYRNALQPTQDGNTVDIDVEKVNYMRNSMEYMASLSFLSGRIKSLRSAIRGE